MNSSCLMVICFTVIMSVTIASTTYLISVDREWWGLLVLLVGGSVSMKSGSVSSETETKSQKSSMEGAS